VEAAGAPGLPVLHEAWQLITHTPSSPTYRRLRSPVSPEERDLYGSFRPTEQVWLAWERTREIASILDAHVVVFQCPKSFVPTRENLRNLRTFFDEIERDGRTLAWEPRGDEWPQELIRDICMESRLIHCVDPFKSDPVYGDGLYWRLHGRSGYRYSTPKKTWRNSDEIRGSQPSAGTQLRMFNNIYSNQDALRS
jgi:uncharacterized protein YecE (DUF72 family)